MRQISLLHETFVYNGRVWYSTYLSIIYLPDLGYFIGFHVFTFHLIVSQ